MWYKGFNPTQRLSKNSCLKFFFSFCFYGLSVLFFKVIYVACNRTKSFFRWPALVNIITSCSSSPPFLFLTAPVTGNKRRATSYRDRKQEAVGVWRGGWFPGAGRETETPPSPPATLSVTSSSPPRQPQSRQNTDDGANLQTCTQPLKWLQLVN